MTTPDVQEKKGTAATERRQPFRKNLRKPRRRSARRGRPRSEFDHKVIDVRRVTRVVAGGRRFSFSVALVAGNRKGTVGVGVGKAGDTALAIEKAQRDAKKNMIVIARTESNSIPHEVAAKYASVELKIFPTPSKGGLTAGSAVRDVLELGGVKDVGAKIHSRTKNKMNIARAALKALVKLPGTKRVDPKQATKDSLTKSGARKNRHPRTAARTPAPSAR